MPRIVCEVITVESVQGKDKLKKLTVDVGASEPISVTTNAPNVRVGTRTVIATIGTELEMGGESITGSFILHVTYLSQCCLQYKMYSQQ